MVRPINKLPKIERLKAAPEMKIETMPAYPTTLELNLTNLEPYTEAEMNVNIDLGLDQIEEQEE